MANDEHWALLKRGVKTVWNKWRRENPEIQPDLANVALPNINLCGADFKGANLRGANLSGADLSQADLREVDLSGAYLDGANLSGANLKGAKINRETAIAQKWYLVWEILNKGTGNRNLSEVNLSGAFLGGANLCGAHLSGANLCGADVRGSKIRRANFDGANLSRANFSGADLYKASFCKANFESAELIEANLGGANLSQANLKTAQLIRVQALNTNFSEAIFTDACLENWNINTSTNLDNIICDYVYLQDGNQERCPLYGNFLPGDFTNFLRRNLETINLVFYQSIDWKAFSDAFKNAQFENQDAKLDILNIEKKENGILTVQVKVSSNGDKFKVHNDLMQGYETALKALETTYHHQVENQQQEINRLFHLI
ncbi:pentapeptide repeat-containing protein [Scytonema sp. UIC 10036]|uniref:pentapeptide repeat-containing protein n=1 Tax=Scytonema sp. UIC 10036 TaxID=2304196 RepID=UPI0012DAC180|nr:pentapeptide repeat-containing protein [Scytonema sp. UIC 10036]MUG99036.1 pentapeptide repeat-containing protein [Scytonema sp. UIC 10036]